MPEHDRQEINNPSPVQQARNPATLKTSRPDWRRKRAMSAQAGEGRPRKIERRPGSRKLVGAEHLLKSRNRDSLGIQRALQGWWMKVRLRAPSKNDYSRCDRFLIARTTRLFPWLRLWLAGVLQLKESSHSPALGARSQNPQTESDPKPN